MRILLIEDNPELRKIYLLTLDDYEVTSATTVAEANFMLGRRQFDLVLSDFNLTDGTSAKVFEQFPCPAPHVLLMTGASDDPQFQQMISRFGFPFLAKPFPPSVLRQRIEEMAAQPNLA
jgi:DNA-binding NtrC family response regulator